MKIKHLWILSSSAGPPSSPRIAITDPPSVDGNVLHVCWLQSLDSGGSPDLHYNIYTLEAGDTEYTRVSTVQPAQTELICDRVELNEFSSFSVVVTAASGATNDPSNFSDVSVVQDRFIVFYVATCAGGKWVCYRTVCNNLQIPFSLQRWFLLFELF